MRILLLEDNPADAELIEYALRESLSDFVLERVETEKAFLKELLEFSPDLILSDYDLPLYNGASALAEAKKKCPDTPFILVTGAVSEDRAIEILTSGAWDYVLKTRLQQRLVPAARRALMEAEERKARKKAEEELKESEKRAREQLEEIKSIYDSAHIGLCVLDRELRYVRINQRLAEMNGIPATDHIGKSIHEIVPDIAPTIEQIAERIFQSGEPVLNYELTRISPAGVHRAVLEHLLPLKDIDGNVIGINVVIEDITEYKLLEGELRKAHSTLESQVKKRTAELGREVAEHKHAMQELRESEERFRAAFDYGAVPMAMTAPDGTLIRVNAAFSEMLGYPEEELAKMNYREITHPDDIAAKEAGLAPVMRGEKRSFRMEKRYIRKDGQIVWADMSTASVHDASGRPLYIITCSQDITERKLAEEELRLKNFAFDASLAANSIADLDHAITQANTAFLRIWGYQSKGEVIGKSISDFFQNRAEAAAIMEAINGTGRWEGTFTAKKKDGSTFIAQGLATTVEDPNGKIIGYQSSVLDITEGKQIEEKLRGSESRFRAIFEQAPLGIALMETSTGKFLDVNKKCLEIMRLSKEDLRADFQSLTHPEDLPSSMDFMRQLIVGKISSYNLEKRYLRRDGSVFWVSLTVIPMWDVGDAPLSHIAIVEDITERKQAEEELKKREELLR